MEVLKGRKGPPPDIMGSVERPTPLIETNRDLLEAKRGRRVNGVSQDCDM